MNILINGQVESFNPTDLPMLISGVDKAGASLFTVTTAINLLRNGNKILFLSAYPMAIKKFMELLTEQERSDVEIVESEISIQGKRAIIIKPGDENLFFKTYNSLHDQSDRVVILKNFERYTKAVELVINNPNVILSGNVDATPYLATLKNKKFNTQIFFSKPKLYPTNWPTALEKYTGIITNHRLKGLIKLQTE